MLSPSSLTNQNQSRPRQIVITGSDEQRWLVSLPHIIRNFRQQVNHLLEYRELIYTLVIRELKVRYKDSVLGILWSLMNPLLMMMVFTVVFTILTPVANVEHFPVFLLCGLLPWNFFTASVMGSTISLVGNAGLIKKVYFPREALPIAVTLANLVHFFIAMIILFGFIFVYNIPLTIWIIYLPLIVFVQIVYTIGVGLLLATANVFYRDTQQIMDVLLLAWFFFTPIFYPLDVLPKSYELFGVTLDVWRLMYIVNPMASLVANYRVILYDGGPPALDFLARTGLTAGLVFVLGWIVFQHYSWQFAEEL